MNFENSEKEISQSIGGNLINAYLVCPRKAWLYAKQIFPQEDHSYLELGRLIHQESYSRSKKEIELPGIKIDVIPGKEHIVVGEVKKSSKHKEAARLQLAYYLYRLKKLGMDARGELLFPKERKKEEVVLSKELQNCLESILFQLQRIVNSDKPPASEKRGSCRGCAYREFCWA